MARDTCVVFGKSGGVGPFFRFCFSEHPAPAKKLFSPVFLTEKYSISGFRLRVRLRHRSSSRQPSALEPPTRINASAQLTHSRKVKCAISNTAPVRVLPRFLSPRRFNAFSSSAKPTTPQRLANPAPCKNKGGVKKGRSWVHFRPSAIVYQARHDTGLRGAARPRSGQISIQPQHRISTAIYFRPSPHGCWSVGGTSNNTSNNHKPFSLNNLTLLF